MSINVKKLAKMPIEKENYVQMIYFSTGIFQLAEMYKKNIGTL